MENDNDVRGYAKLGKNRRNKSYNCNNFANMSPPQDAYNAVYLSFVFGGAGFLLPYNSFIMAMDYFKIRYPETPIVFEMSLVYIIVAFFTVLGNNLLVEIFSLNARINFGYIMSFFTLIFVVICEVWWEAFETTISYEVNLAAVAIVAVGCTVQQSSFYGYTSMLPARYTQAVMVGESASGVFTSSIRVLTRFLIPEIRGSTIYFFSVSVSAVTTCFVMYHLIRRTDFIQFYINLCERAKTKITLEPTEDAGLIDNKETPYGVLKIQNNSPAKSSLSFANPAYEPTVSVSFPTYKVEDVITLGRPSTSGISIPNSLSSFKRKLLARWTITKAIYPYMISICLVYFATLCLYPGIASEIISCHLTSWMPILMMAFFNGADLFGKILASASRYWTGARLVQCSVLRLLMIPLMILCILPRSKPFFSTEITAFIFALTLGFSNGILGSVPMIQASSKVDDCHRELTGNLMTLLYNFGLTTGSLMAYCLESFLTPVDNHFCDLTESVIMNMTTPTVIIQNSSVTLTSFLIAGTDNGSITST